MPLALCSFPVVALIPFSGKNRCYVRVVVPLCRCLSLLGSEWTKGSFARAVFPVFEARFVVQAIVSLRWDEPSPTLGVTQPHWAAVAIGETAFSQLRCGLLLWKELDRR